MLTDTLLVKELEISQPNDIYQCDEGASTYYDLSEKNAAVLNIDSNVYEINYYSSLDNANNHEAIPKGQITNFQCFGNEWICVKLNNIVTNSFCLSSLSFELKVITVAATAPEDLLVCEDINAISIPLNVEAAILKGLNSSNYLVSYFLSQDDANNLNNAIGNPSNYYFPGSDTAILTRVVSTFQNECFDVVGVNINTEAPPLVDRFSRKVGCYKYELPELINSIYYTGSNGTGTRLEAGGVIEQSSFFYIYNINSNGCLSESNFKVHIFDQTNHSGGYCSQFELTQAHVGFCFRAPAGPNGCGRLIPTDTIITETTPIYYYLSSFDDGKNICTIDTPVTINLNQNSDVDVLDDVFS